MCPGRPSLCAEKHRGEAGRFRQGATYRKIEDTLKRQQCGRCIPPVSISSEALFASNGKPEVIHPRADQKAHMWATEIESLEPEKTLTDEITRLVLEMMKVDGYRIVSSSHFRFLHVSETGDGSWDDGSPEKAYIMPVCIPGDDEEGAGVDEHDDGDGDGDSADEKEEVSWGDGATSKEKLSTSHCIVAQAQRRRPLPSQDFVVTILNSGSGSEQQDDVIKRYIRQGLLGATAESIFSFFLFL